MIRLWKKNYLKPKAKTKFCLRAYLAALVTMLLTTSPVTSKYVYKNRSEINIYAPSFCMP